MGPAKHPARTFLAAALLACYGILALVATGPHPHDFLAAGQGYEHDAAVSAAHAPAPGPGTTQRAECPLCIWTRGATRLAPVAPSGIPRESIPCHRPDSSPTFRVPCSRWTLERAPPAA